MDGTELIKIGTVESVEGIKVKVRFQSMNTASQTLTAIDHTTVVEGGTRYTNYQSGGSGEAAFSSHRHSIKRWVPNVGDRVLCIMIPNGNGQGFVIGTI